MDSPIHPHMSLLTHHHGQPQAVAEVDDLEVEAPPLQVEGAEEHLDGPAGEELEACGMRGWMDGWCVCVCVCVSQSIAA